MKKTIILFFLMFAGLSVIFSQTGSSFAEPGILTGKVTDAASGGHPLEYATISVYKADSSLVTGIITDKNGEFRIELDKGNYFAVIQFISYNPDTLTGITISARNPVADLGTVILKPQSTKIEEAYIVGEKSEMVIHLDKKIFNVGKDLNNAGKSASEILDNIPSVTVDAEGNVSLRGSQNLQILIDGKPSGLVSAENTDALRSIQGNIIDHVEVITNPSARYQAEGMAGIINIVLKKDRKKGINGSFEASAGYPDDYSFGTSLNFRREKINYFFNYGVRYFNRPGEGSAFQRFMLPDTSYITRMEREQNRKGWSHNLRAGADFMINEKNTLTLSSVFGYDDQKNTTNLFYRDYDLFENLLMTTNRIDNEAEKEKNIEFSLNYTRLFEKKDQKLTLLGQYINEDELEESDITENLLFHYTDENLHPPLLQSSANDEGQENFLVQADYQHPFSEKGRIEAGYRSEFRTITNPYSVEQLNDAGEWVNLSEFTNRFEYHENVHAFYIQAGNEFGKISLLAGLRSETSDIETYQEVTDERNLSQYTDLFPTLHTSYNLNTKNSFQVSYSRRINRPHFWLLNPFYSFSDSRNIRSGNPEVEPEYTHSLEAGYVMNHETFSFYGGVYYQNTKGVIERINFVDTSGITFQIPYNLSERNSAGIESNLSLDAFSWWKLNTDANVYHSVTEGNHNGETLRSETFSFNVRFNSKMSFKNNLDIQTTFFYRAPEETTQGERKAFYMLNAAVAKDILKGNGTLTLGVTDLLNSRKFRFILDNPQLYSENEFRWSRRTVRLTFMYRINQMKKTNGRDSGEPGGEGMDF